MSGDDEQPITIARIARRAGVSVPTVSKVLNGHGRIAADTRARIERVIQEEGYRPRPRRRQRNPVVTLVFEHLDGLWALEIVRGVRRRARDAGLDVLVDETDPGPGPDVPWPQRVIRARPHGVVAVATGLTAEQQAAFTLSRTPLVVLDPSGEPVHGTPSVGAANWSGGYAATRHLIGLGHRRIAAVGGPPDVVCARARLDGFRAAMDAAGLPTHGLVRSADFLVDGGRAAVLALLDRPERPTAVVMGNDLQALGGYQAAAACGLRVPEDLSIVGFDDLPVARWCVPELTTVRQPLFEMAVAATDLLLGLGQGRSGENERVECSTALVVRGSTAPPAVTASGSGDAR